MAFEIEKYIGEKNFLNRFKNNPYLYGLDIPNANKNINALINDTKNRKADKYLKIYNKKIEGYLKKNQEAIADKNIPSYLKQIGMPKADRRAHYYIKKKIIPRKNDRYHSKFGDLKYLKDYIFGFSLLPENYYFYKPLSPEWKDMMREHFYDIYFSNQYKLFHLSDKGNLETLYPKVPNNYFTSIGYERNDIARISFSTSIYGCLRGLSSNIQNKRYFVYTPIGEYKIITPKKSEVPDIKYIDEKWILEPVKAKCIGQITVSYPQKNHPLNYRYGQQNATLYGWNYKWLFKE